MYSLDVFIRIFIVLKCKNICWSKSDISAQLRGIPNMQCMTPDIAASQYLGLQPDITDISVNLSTRDIKEHFV